MKIAITGANGFVGQSLTGQFQAMGHQVRAFSRKTGYSIESCVAEGGLAGIDLLVHCAWDFNARDDRNVTGSSNLFDSARRDGVGKTIFISTLSAFDGCRSRYGQTKLAVERKAASVNACSVRLGFVWDDSNRGLSGALRKSARLPWVPLPGAGAQKLFAIRAEDLAPALLKVDGGECRKPIAIAHPQPVTLRRMIEVFARQQGRHPLFLPVPWRLMWLPLRVAEAFGIRSNFRSGSLVSLMNQEPRPDFTFLEQSGIELRAFPLE